MSVNAALEKTFSKNIFIVKRMILLSIKIFLYICVSIFNINNNFAIKNDKISHSENFNHASHLKRLTQILFCRLQNVLDSSANTDNKIQLIKSCFESNDNLENIFKLSLLYYHLYCYFVFKFLLLYYNILFHFSIHVFIKSEILLQLFFLFTLCFHDHKREILQLLQNYYKNVCLISKR